MYEIFASIGKYKQEKDQEKDQERNWQVVHSTTIFAFFLFNFFSFFFNFLSLGMALFMVLKKAQSSLYSVNCFLRSLWHMIKML